MLFAKLRPTSAFGYRQVRSLATNRRPWASSRAAMVYGRARWPLVATTAIVAYFSSGYILSGSGDRSYAVSAEPKRQQISLLNPAQVSATLREREESYLVQRGNGVLRYDLSQLPSNNPIEDDHAERIVEVPLVSPQDEEYSTDWMFWGIYDGHGGWTTSAKLRDTLISSVTRELDRVYKPVTPNQTRRLPPAPTAVDQAMIDAFVKLDDQIVHKSVQALLENPNKKSAIEAIPPALSGSCALLAFYDSASCDLRVALAGDSRAVLGVRGDDGAWKAKSLTTDQTGSNEDEARRIKSEHPGEEETAVRRGRVLGIYEPTRAFGDASTKWSREIQHKLARMFFGRSVPRDLRTPPYMTAEPVLTRTRIDPNRPTFMVLATDGLFEMLSNEQVVGLVVEWLEKKQPESLSSIIDVVKKPETSWTSRFFGSRRQDHTVEDISQNKDSQKQPVRRQSQSSVKITVQDNNVGTHLMRNALGGSDQEQVSMLVSIPSPMSRRYRDDLTVTVVFFGESEYNSGKVRVNPEATLDPKLKAKL